MDVGGSEGLSTLTGLAPKPSQRPRALRLPAPLISTIPTMAMTVTPYIFGQQQPPSVVYRHHPPPRTRATYGALRTGHVVGISHERGCCGFWQRLVWAKPRTWR